MVAKGVIYNMTIFFLSSKPNIFSLFTRAGRLKQTLASYARSAESAD